MKNNVKDPLVQPFVKWVGGKRQLIERIIPLIDENCSTYVEPFIGGGAVLFALQPKKAIINDYNEELVNVYNVIKNEPEKLIAKLKKHARYNSSDYYYEIRELDRRDDYSKLSDVDKAARIVYLNKTCYNGLYRVSSVGFFNTPYGRYLHPNIVNEKTIMAVSHYLNANNIQINCGDYKATLRSVKKGAFVYLDPPYYPISKSSTFTGYTDGGFSYEQQVELRDECKKLYKKGVKFLQSNSDCEEIRELYSDKSIFTIKTVKAKRNINSNATKRGEINEVLIYNG